MKFKRFSLLHSFPQMLLDIICVFFSYWFAFVIRFEMNINIPPYYMPVSYTHLYSVSKSVPSLIAVPATVSVRNATAPTWQTGSP